jgi:lipoprotein-releasing system ATP-binding protein
MRKSHTTAVGPPTCAGSVDAPVYDRWVLQVAGLVKDYPTPAGPLRVIDDVSFTLPARGRAALMGPSGSGKSSLLYILGGLEPPTTGTVTLNGHNPYALNPVELARFRNREVGFVFQDHCLLPQCTVIENVLVPTLVGETDGTAPARAHELLQQVGLGERLHHRPGQLSGGEKQRAAIARALIRRPTLLLCDEPTGNLDADTADTVAGLLLDLHQREGTLLLVVTHSAALASRFDHRWRIERGRLTA